MSLINLAEVPPMATASGDEALIGVSNGNIVRMPLSAVGNSDPVILTILTSEFNSSVDEVMVYSKNGSSLNAGDVVNLMISGNHVILVGRSNDINTSYAYNVIAATNTMITIIYNGSIKQYRYAEDQSV